MLYVETMVGETLRKNLANRLGLTHCVASWHTCDFWKFGIHPPRPTTDVAGY